MLVRSLKHVFVATAALATLVVSPGLDTAPKTGDASAVSGLIAVGEVEAQPRPRPACNLKAFPLVAGVEWVYEARQIPGQAAPKQPPPKPIQPTHVIIKILSVQQRRAS